MKAICKQCGEEFTHDHQDVEMWKEGFIDELPKICADCFRMKNDNISDYTDFSDADPGL